VPSGTSQPRPELVILISLDTLRADHLDLHGYARETAPNLRALGEQGAFFRTVAAQSAQTLTSHKSILTGKYPATLMLEQTGADLLELSALHDAREYLVDTFQRVKGTLAETFRQRGFRTAGFTDGAWMSRAAGFAHGFEDFDDAGGGLEASVPRALAWLEQGRAGPAFLFLHADDVHCPYTAPEPFDGAFCPDHSAHVALAKRCGPGAPPREAPAPADLAALVDHYDGDILAADHQLGRFFDALRARKLYERALIVVTSSHGESLGERGLVGHGGLYPEQLFVPLILKLPASWNQAPIQVSEPAEMVDLVPTLFALCGVPAQSDLDGRSLLPALFRGVRGRDFLVAQTVFEEGPGPRSSPAMRTVLRPGRWQVIHDVERSEASFFALERDPRALLAHPIGASEFEPLLDLLLERERAQPRAPRRRVAPVAFSAELERELELLGYGTARAGHGADDDLR
ncbi:MAG: sulfatase, partial [Planctomycetes bacterium]|nr:sulfatase [Planctomycetota bacterium]